MASIHSGQQIVKFNKFLIRCNTLNTEEQAQTLSKFRTRLREDLRTELLARGVNKLEVAYTLAQDLDSLRSNYNTRSFDSKSSVSGTSFPSSISLAPHPPPERILSRTKIEMTVAKLPNKTVPKLVLPPSGIDVNVMGTSQLTVVVKLISPLLMEFP